MLRFQSSFDRSRGSRLRGLWVLLLATILVVVGAVDVEASEPDGVVGPELMDDLTGQVPCDVEAVAGGIQCVAAGEPIFELLHPSLFPDPRRYRQRTDGMMPAGPVTFDGDVLYGVDNDLLRFDSRRRQIVDRVRFPASIADLAVDGSTVEVTVEAPPHRTDRQIDGPQKTHDVTIAHDLDGDTIPGRAPWDWTGTLGALHDGMWLESVELGGVEVRGAGSEYDEASNRAAIARLQWRQRRDGTNPFLPLFRGELLDRSGDDEAAVRAYREALDHPEADWIDRLRLAVRLQMRGRLELAEEAANRATRQMEEAGVRGEYVTAVVNGTYAFVWHQQIMEQAVEAGDTEIADAMARRIDALFPNLEGSEAAWRRLAAFFDRHGRSELADEWRDRADRGQQLDHPGRFFEEAATAVDLYLVLQMALLLTALLAGLMLGMWRYDEDETSEELDGWRAYLPRFYLVDITALVGIFVALVLVPMIAASPMQSMATIAEAPPAASGDALAAPAVGEWADDLAPTSARDELVAESERELEATRGGGQGPGDVDLNRLIVDAVEADTRARSLRTFADVEASEAAKQEFEWLRPLVDVDIDTSALVLVLLALAFNALIFGGLLQAVARRFEPLARIGRIVIVGAPNSLRWLRFPVLVTFVTGLLMMTPLSRAIQASTEASMATHFGLDQAPSGIGTGWMSVGFALIVVALVIHAIGIVRDRE